ncbi:MAG: hypothetical protein Q9162_001046 [Coniocarpon cinnabarinum]
MSVSCLFRGPRKWIIAGLFTIAIACQTIVVSKPEVLRGASFRLPYFSGSKPLALVAKDPPEHQSILQSGPIGPHHDALEDGRYAQSLTNAVGDASVTVSDSGPTQVVTDAVPTDTLSAGIGSHPEMKASLVSDAHSLPSADAFLPHFAALQSVPNLTVADAMKTCIWTDKELASFQFNEDAPWRVNHTPDIVIAYQRHQWQQFVQNGLIPWSSVSHRFDGRGIVIVAGHPKSIKRAKAILRSLLTLKSTVSVELHYFGEELDDATKAELLGLYHHPDTLGTALYFNDLASSDQILKSTYNKKVKINYNLKTAAVVSSRFAEPLLLDADNIPAIDPALLWESETYKRYGSVFWPDMSRTRAEHPAWAITNTACRKNEYEFESGQVLVDKRKFFYHLQLAAFWGEQPYWHDTLLGDKDLFRFAWHALQTEFGTPRKWITSMGFLAEQEVYGQVQLDYCGHTFAQHHPDARDGHLVNGVGQSGIAFFHGGTLKSVSAPLLTRLRENVGGIFTHYKRSLVDEQWDNVDYNVGLRYWSAGYYYNNTKEPILTGDEDFDKDGTPISSKDMSVLKLTEASDSADLHADVLCTDWGQVEARPIKEIDEQSFDKRFEEAGGYWMIEDGYRWGKSGAETLSVSCGNITEVVRHFTKLNYRIRAVTRNPSSSSTEPLKALGAEVVKGDVDDVSSLIRAFDGADVIFGMTNFWGLLDLPITQTLAQSQSIPLNEAAMHLEMRQGQNMADAAAQTPTLHRYIWSTLSDTKKWSNGTITHNYHFDGKAAVQRYIEEQLPDLASKTSWLQVGFYLSNLDPGPSAPRKQPDGTFLFAHANPKPSTLVPMVDPSHDTGRFVEALVSSPAGTTLLGTSEEMSLPDWAQTWAKVHGVECKYATMPKEDLEAVFGPLLYDEVWDTFRYAGEIGYDGGDPDVRRPWDLGVKKEELMGVEEYLRSKDWSSVLKG